MVKYYYLTLSEYKTNNGSQIYKKNFIEGNECKTLNYIYIAIFCHGHIIEKTVIIEKNRLAEFCITMQNSVS